MDQQEATTIAPVTTRSAGVRYGLIGAVIGIIYFILLRVAGLDMQGPAGYVGYVLSAVLIFLAQKYYKDNGDGYLDYSQGIGIAFWYGLVASAISSVFSYVYIKFVDPAFIEDMKNKQIEQMQSQGMSDAQVDQAMKVASMFMSAESIFIMGLIFSIISAIIIALIVTLFTQKKRPEGSALDA